jgi:hypothetical protein
MPYTFKTDQSTLTHRNGQVVTIVEHITEPSQGFDAEVLPMMRIRFADGYVTECWPDELTEHVAVNNYGSNGYYR